MKRIFGIFLALISFIQVQESIASDWLPESYKASTSTGWGYRISDKIQTRNSGIVAIGLPGIKDAFGRGGMTICNSAIDVSCKDAQSIQAYAFLGICSDQINSFACIQSLTVNKNNLKFVNYLSQKKVFESDSTVLLPEGSSMELWSTIEANPRYFVSAVSTSLTLKPARSDNATAPLNLTIQEVSPVNCEACTSSEFRIIKTAEGASLIQDYEDRSVGNGDCYLSTKGLCLRRVEMNIEDQIGITLRIPKQWSNWYFGRIDKPIVSDDELHVFSGVLTRTTSISGNPVNVQVVGEFSANLFEVPPAVYAGLSRNSEGVPLGTFIPNLSGSSDTAWAVGLTWTSVGDMANSSSTTWSIMSISKFGSKCSENSGLESFQGLVFTNSLLFSNAPPQLINGELTYKVAGRHLNSDGTLSSGMYGMLLGRSFAQCIYNNSLEGASASISVIDQSSGVKTVQTQTISNNGNYLKFYSSGFNFSTKELSVKIIPDLKLSKTKDVLAKKFSITCKNSNGKTKKITGINPKCPAGYKKQLK